MIEAEKNDVYRWKLISLLFTSMTGVLSKGGRGTSIGTTCCNSNHKKKLEVNEQNYIGPLSVSQSQRCAKEVYQLAALISSGSMGQPHENKIIINLIHKVIGLEAEGLMHNFFSSKMKTTMKKNDTKLVKKLWNKSDIRLDSKITSDEIQLAIRLKEDFFVYSPVEENQSLFTLSSSSGVVRSVIFLVTSWISNSPNKKAIWYRLKNSLTTLIDGFCKDIEGCIQNVEIHQDDSGSQNVTHQSNSIGEDFSRMFFASSTESSTIPNTLKSGGMIYRETASSILLGIVHVRAQYAAKVKKANASIAPTRVLDGDSVQVIPTDFPFFIGILDDSFCLQVFLIVRIHLFFNKLNHKISSHFVCFLLQLFFVSFG